MHHTFPGLSWGPEDDVNQKHLEAAPTVHEVGHDFMATDGSLQTTLGVSSVGYSGITLFLSGLTTA